MAQPCACGCGGVAINKYVHGHNSRVAHPMKGRPMPEELKNRLSEMHRGKPGPMLGKRHSEETRKKMSKSHKGVPLSEEHNRNAHAARMKNGYRHSEETRRKISETEKGKVVSEDTRQRISDSKKGKRLSPGTEFTSEGMKANYLDPAYVAKMKTAWNMKPNKAEIFLMDLLDRLYPGEWKYTGDFSMTINGKCPDFVNCNGQKKIIEYFGDHWHQGHDPEERASAFSPFGYQTLVIWGSEMKNLEGVTDRIHAFMEA